MLVPLSTLKTLSGLDLVAARDTYSRNSLPETLDPRFQETYFKGSYRTLNYDELQDRAASPHHFAMCRTAIAHFNREKYCIYPNGVGVNGILAFADFAAHKEGRTIFVECLTVKSILREGMLEHKMQLARHGIMCIVVPHPVERCEAIFQKLLSISKEHEVFIYTGEGVGSRRNRLTEINAYRFFSCASKELPPYTFAMVRKRISAAIRMELTCAIPPTLKEIELKEIWRRAFERAIEEKREFLTGLGLKKYHYKSFRMIFAPAIPGKRDSVRITILGRAAEIALKGEWGKNLVVEVFGGLIGQVGVSSIESGNLRAVT